MIIRSQLRRSIRNGVASVRSQDGIALVLALIVLLSLTGLVLAFLSMSALEPLISQNLADATSARMLADSGIDVAFDTLVNTADWSTVIAAATSRSCMVGDTGIIFVAYGTPLPGLPAGHGTFGVRVRNDCQPGDDRMTGTPIEGSRPTSDGNGRLILQSTGFKNGAARTVSVVAFKARMFDLNAALAFPGLQANIGFPTSVFTIDGRDTRLTDAVGLPTGLASPKFGITVAHTEPNNATIIQTALRNSPQNFVAGQSATAAGTAIGDQAVTPSDTLTSQRVVDFVSAVKGMADITIDVSAGQTYTGVAIGSTCGSNLNDARCWGTDTHPKIVYVKGALASVTQPAQAISLSEGTTGTGILIVENASLEVLGDLTWHGPIIATGTNVGIRLPGSGPHNVHGGVVVNELRADGIVDLDAGLRGNARLMYSKDALDLVLAGLARRMTTTMNWREK